MKNLKSEFSNVGNFLDKDEVFIKHAKDRT